MDGQLLPLQGLAVGRGPLAALGKELCGEARGLLPLIGPSWGFVVSPAASVQALQLLPPNAAHPCLLPTAPLMHAWGLLLSMRLLWPPSPQEPRLFLSCIYLMLTERFGSSPIRSLDGASSGQRLPPPLSLQFPVRVSLWELLQKQIRLQLPGEATRPIF